jgi:filamentous hemagglutinin family protein
MNDKVWALLLCSGAVFANPVGEAVAGGDVGFTRNGDELHVSQKSDRAVVEWENFSIAAGELTKFIQPGPDSVLLNRVVGHEMSSIYGKLEANGQIILMNPHGVFVGKTGVIDTCAFLVTSHDMNNLEFMEGKKNFAMNDLSSVINVEGRIEADRIEIIGDRIFLTGELSSPGGEIKVDGNIVELLEAGLLDVSGTADAGTVFVHSTQMTKFLGSIHAKGGSQGGDGGIVEVSGEYGMIFQGSVDTHAMQGKNGSLILDPIDVEIVTGGGAICADVDQFADPGTLVQIDPATLTACGTVVIQATQDITVTNAVTLNTLENFTAQAGRNIIVNAAIDTDGGNITLLAGPFSEAPSPITTGSVTLNESLVNDTMGAAGGSIIVQGFNITSSTSSPHRTSSGNISFFANGDILASDHHSIFSSDTGKITVYANGNVTFSPSGSITTTGSFSGTQIDVRADFDQDGVGDFYLQSSDGFPSGFTANGGDIFVGGYNITLKAANPIIENSNAFIVTQISGTVEVQAGNDVTLQGGNSTANVNAFLSSADSVLVRAGHDINLLGGNGTNAGAIITANTVSLIGNANLIAGNDILMDSQDGGDQISANQCFLTAGRDIAMRAGPNSFNSAVVNSNLNPATIKAGRNILFTAGASGAVGGIVDNGIGCDVRAAGDIVWAFSYTSPDSFQSIYIAADASLIPVYPAQAGPYLTNTPLATALNIPSNGLGAFSVDTSPNSDGIQLSTIDFGSITLYSAAQFYDGTVANILFDETTTPNALKLLSFDSGDISVAGFNNTDINNTISTNGAILISTNNNMNINTPAGFITAGGPITLIVDEQAPLTNGGGFFNNFNSGVSTTDPDQRIAIYAASGPQAPVGFSFPNQVILGNLIGVATWDINKPLGLLSKYGTSYEDGGPVHGAGFGTNYVAGNGVFSSPVIWYKVSQQMDLFTDDALAALQQLRTLMPERLWVQEFSILIDQNAFIDHLNILIKPSKRESAIASRFAIASSKDYLLRSTLSGENIRLLDRYQEFQHSPFWRTPDMLETLYWLEEL